MQISGATKKQHDFSRLNRHAAFLFIIFSGCLYRVHKLTSHFFAPSSQNIAGEPPSPPNLSYFRRIPSPLLGGFKRPGFPIQMLFTSFLRIPFVIYFMFFACKTQSTPGRSRLASLSTNIICRIFSGMCYFFEIFFEIFFIFFCELSRRKFSILFIAYTFECYM